MSLRSAEVKSSCVRCAQCKMVTRCVARRGQVCSLFSNSIRAQSFFSNFVPRRFCSPCEQQWRGREQQNAPAKPEPNPRLPQFVYLESPFINVGSHRLPARRRTLSCGQWPDAWQNVRPMRQRLRDTVLLRRLRYVEGSRWQLLRPLRPQP